MRREHDDTTVLIAQDEKMKSAQIGEDFSTGFPGSSHETNLMFHVRIKNAPQQRHSPTLGSGEACITQ